MPELDYNLIKDISDNISTTGIAKYNQLKKQIKSINTGIPDKNFKGITDTELTNMELILSEYGYMYDLSDTQFNNLFSDVNNFSQSALGLDFQKDIQTQISNDSSYSIFTPSDICLNLFTSDNNSGVQLNRVFKYNKGTGDDASKCIVYFDIFGKGKKKCYENSANATADICDNLCGKTNYDDYPDLNVTDTINYINTDTDTYITDIATGMSFECTLNNDNYKKLHNILNFYKKTVKKDIGKKKTNYTDTLNDYHDKISTSTYIDKALMMYKYRYYILFGVLGLFILFFIFQLSKLFKSSKSSTSSSAIPSIMPTPFSSTTNSSSSNNKNNSNNSGINNSRNNRNNGNNGNNSGNKNNNSSNNSSGLTNNIELNNR